MQAVSFQSATFSSVQNKSTLQSIPQCYFGDARENALQKFIQSNKYHNLGLVEDEEVHRHELGHMMADYASSNDPLGITFNTVVQDNKTIHAHIVSYITGSNELKKLASNVWNQLAGGVFQAFERHGKSFAFPQLAALAMHGDIKQLAARLKRSDLSDSFNCNELIQDIDAMNDANLKDSPSKTTLQEKYIQDFFKLLSRPPVKRSVEGLMQLKETIGTEKLEKLRQGILQNNGWIIGDTFRAQLYEKVFTAAERQQFEKIYQEFEREFLALPEIQTLSAKK